MFMIFLEGHFHCKLECFKTKRIRGARDKSRYQIEYQSFQGVKFIHLNYVTISA